MQKYQWHMPYVVHSYFGKDSLSINTHWTHIKFVYKHSVTIFLLNIYNKLKAALIKTTTLSHYPHPQNSSTKLNSSLQFVLLSNWLTNFYVKKQKV